MQRSNELCFQAVMRELMFPGRTLSRFFGIPWFFAEQFNVCFVEIKVDSVDDRFWAAADELAVFPVPTADSMGRCNA